ncbi:MAG TPA: 50S ribosomal protein L30 [Candidatus Limnocylindria bacterium]
MAVDRPAGTQLLVVQKKSAIGEKEAARGTLRALGLGRPGKRAHLEDSPQLRGMLRKVAHLIEVKERKR